MSAERIAEIEARANAATDELMDALMEWYDRQTRVDVDAHGARARFQSTMRASIHNIEAAGYEIRASDTGA